MNRMLKACVNLATSKVGKESNLKFLRTSVHDLIKGKKKNTESLIERYNLLDIITADMSAKIMPMYAILSLYDLELNIQGGIQLLPGGGLEGVPLEIKSRELFLELSQKMIDTDSLTTRDIAPFVESEYSSNFKFWSNAMHITTLEKEYVWWRDNTSVNTLLTKARTTHWVRFLQCNYYLGFSSKKTSKQSPHPFLPTQLGQLDERLINEMAGEMTNQLNKTRRSLSNEETYYSSLRRTLIWLSSGVEWDV